MKQALYLSLFIRQIDKAGIINLPLSAELNSFSSRILRHWNACGLEDIMPGRYYGYYYYDPTYMLIIISALISLFAQFHGQFQILKNTLGYAAAQA